MITTSVHTTASPMPQRFGKLDWRQRETFFKEGVHLYADTNTMISMMDALASSGRTPESGKLEKALIERTLRPPINKFHPHIRRESQTLRENIAKVLCKIYTAKHIELSEEGFKTLIERFKTATGEPSPL